MTDKENQRKLEREIEQLKTDVGELETQVDHLSAPPAPTDDGQFDERTRAALVRPLESLYHAIQLGPSHPAKADAKNKLEEFKREVGVWG